MKTRTFLTNLMVGVTLLSGLAIQAIAQAPPGGRGGGGPGALTPEQRTKLTEAMAGSQSEMTALTTKLADAQKEVLKAALAKDADEKTLRPKFEAVAKIQTDIAVLRLKGVKEIASTVTDEQKTAMETRPAFGYAALFGGGFGGGGGAGGRRGGGRGANQN